MVVSMLSSPIRAPRCRRGAIWSDVRPLAADLTKTTTDFAGTERATVRMASGDSSPAWNGTTRMCRSSDRWGLISAAS
ncbi:hypothetical protein DDZ14_18785 [Maritimibacter sp. 55A14]|nr:hypothetical protein DDZ14_18785 [Maritimibacter sp. 55A14]